MKRKSYTFFIIIALIIILIISLLKQTLYKEPFTNNVKKFHHRLNSKRTIGKLAKQDSEYDELKDVNPTETEGFSNKKKTSTKKNGLHVFHSIDVFDQGQSETCTANAISSAMQVFLRNAKNYDIPSRAFIYSNAKYNDRHIWDCSTTGLNTDEAMNASNEYKVPNEHTWPFPSLQALENGDAGVLCNPLPQNLLIPPTKHIRYTELPRGTQQIRDAIDRGHPVLIDLLVYSSIDKADSDKKHLGYIPTPDFSKETYYGSHTMVIIGYNDAKQLLTLRNSWGKSLGDHTGNYTMSYSFIWDNKKDSYGDTPTTALWEVTQYS